MTTQPAYYPVSVAAKHLGVVKQTVYNWLAVKYLTGHTFVEGGALYVVNDKQFSKARRAYLKTVKP